MSPSLRSAVIARKSQDALADDVAQHLARAARDRQAAGVEHRVPEPAGVAFRRHTLLAQQLEAKLCRVLLMLHPDQLADAARRPGVGAGQLAQRRAERQERLALRL